LRREVVSIGVGTCFGGAVSGLSRAPRLAGFEPRMSRERAADEFDPELALILAAVDSWLELMPGVITYVLHGGRKPRGIESARFSRDTAEGFLLWPTGRGWIEEYLAGELGMQPEEAAQGLMLIVPIDTRRLWLRALDILIEKGAISMLDGDVRAVYAAVAKTLGT